MMDKIAGFNFRLIFFLTVNVAINIFREGASSLGLDGVIQDSGFVSVA